jgi:NADPH-dependent glutamate synthase beta subunit-like oxidoreductase
VRHSSERLGRRRRHRSHIRPGVWAAGNTVDPRAQVITAAGEGSAAAIAINNDLVEEDLPLAVANFRLGLPV